MSAGEWEEERQRWIAQHAAAAKEIARLREENERLRTQLEEAQLRSIEARNPGIDIEEVRRIRRGL